MKRKIVTGLLVAAVLACLCVCAIAANGSSLAYLVGLATKPSPQAAFTSQNIAATYNDHEISVETVEFQRKLSSLTQGLRSSDGTIALPTDREIVDQLLQNIIMVEEAERLGIAATEEEVEGMYAVQLENMENAEVKATLEEYLSGAELTLDEYLNNLHEQLPSVISRQKLRDYLGQKYCDEHGLEFTKMNPPEEMTQYVEEYCRELIQTHKDEIVYYVND